MGDDKDSGGGSWYKVPQWDGSPQTFRAFKKEMSWWTQSLDLQGTKKYNLAARWLIRQTGIVRQRGEEFEPEELAYKPAVFGTDPSDDSEVLLEEEDLLFGIKKLMRAFEEMNGKSALDKRGELRNQFYLELARRPGERISEFCTRFRVMVGELKAEGVQLPSTELGWFLRTKLGLDPLREQLLETALAGKEEYDTIEREVLRLFKDLHAADPLHRRVGGEKGSMLQRFLGSQAGSKGPSHPTSSTASLSSSFPRSYRSSTTTSTTSSRLGFRKPGQPFQRQAMATETEETEELGEEVEPEEIEDHGAPQASLEDVLQTEAEVLATELEEAVQEGVDANLLDDLEGSMENAAEALLSMREARQKISEVRKDRGYGRSSNNPSPKKGSGKVMMKKQSPDHRCWDCDLPGHWAGDPECKRPGAKLGKRDRGSNSQSPKKGPRQVQIAETLETQRVGEEEGHEVQAVQHVTRDMPLAVALEEFHKAPKEVNSAVASLAGDKRLVGALDTACNRTCTGSTWLQSYLDHLKGAPGFIRQLIQRADEHEVFRFGNGGTQISHDRWKLPALIEGKLVCFWTSLVPVPSLGLLLGRDFLDALGTVMHFSQRKVRFELIGPRQLPLRQLAAGHFMLPLQPAASGEWPRPDAQCKWRKLGVDGIVELQLDFKSWWHGKVNARSQGKIEHHEHMLSEISMSAGHAVCVAMTSPKPSTVLDRDRDLMVPSALASGAGSSTTSPARSSTLCSPTTSLPSSLASLNGVDIKHSNSRKSQRPDQMDKVHAQDDQEVRMARQRHPALGCAKKLLALCALSVPLGVYMRGLEGAGKQDGFQGRLPVAASSRTRCDHECVHRSQSGRLHLAEEQDWFEGGLRGRSSFGRNVGSQIKSRHGSASEERSLCRSSTSSKGSGFARQTEVSSSRTPGAKRRSSNTQEGSHQAGCLSRTTHQREGYRGGAESYTTTAGGSDVLGGFKPKEVFSQQQHGKAPSQVSSPSPVRRSSSTASGTRNWSRSLPSHLGGKGPINERAGLVADPNGCSIRSYGERRAWNDQGGGSRGHDCRAGLPFPSTVGSSIWRGGVGVSDGGGNQSSARPLSSMDFENPWTLDSELKKGQSLQIAQAWKKHEDDRRRIPKSPREILEVMTSEHFEEMESFMNEVFLSTVDLDFGCGKDHGGGVFLSEVFTNTQRVMKEAGKRGHRVGTPISLETGFDLRRPLDQKAALKIVDKEEPYCLVIAFPCGPFSPLQHLNPNTDPEKRQQKLEEGRSLLRFAVKLARRQRKAGRHFILENPLPSAAWREPELRALVEELDCHIAELDQCRFGLRSLRGFPHKKPTRLATSSPSVAERLHDRRCLRQHVHDPVLGGSKVTSRAGHYPGSLARAMVLGMESQFDAEGGKSFEVNAAEAEEDQDGGDEDFAGGLPGDSDSGEDEAGGEAPKDMVITAAIKQSVKRLHENTGHRSNRRLARALNIAGAPAEVVWAAKHHRCDVCQERKQPKARRPVSLPTPKECSDQVHIDLVEMNDASQGKHMVVHMTDHATRFQLGEVLPDKSTKSVVSFIKRRWMPIFGPPKVLVADQGREFVSWEMEEFCASTSILLWHAAVQAPWQNGVAERSGGILKTIMQAIVTTHSVQGHEEMQDALGEALAAYNPDINEAGVSPSQAVIGRQPRQIGDVIGGSIQSRLAEHGLSEAPGPLARQLALRETAKVAMTRLHFSRGLRRAELARSRSSTVVETPKAGDICYFYRMSKYNSRTAPSKRKLSLRRWHGPALVVALEGSSNAYLSFKGQLTKCSLEHVRPASTMEQIAASTWRDAIEDVVRAAQHDLTLNGLDAGARRDEPAPGANLHLPDGSQSVLPAVAPGTPGLMLPAAALGSTGSSDLPPVQSRELIASLRGEEGAESVLDSSLPSRRQSIGTMPSIAEEDGGGVASRLSSAVERAREMDRQAGLKRSAPTGVSELEGEVAEKCKCSHFGG